MSVLDMQTYVCLYAFRGFLCAHHKLMLTSKESIGKTFWENFHQCIQTSSCTFSSFWLKHTVGSWWTATNCDKILVKLFLSISLSFPAYFASYSFYLVKSRADIQHTSPDKHRIFPRHWKDWEFLCTYWPLFRPGRWCYLFKGGEG